MHHLLLAALIVFASAAPARALPELPPADPACTLYQMSIGDDCAFETRNVQQVTPGQKLTLNQPGGFQYGTALGCGTDACTYWGNGFTFFNQLGGQWSTGVSIDGDCPSYPGLVSAGTPTRDVTATPGVCKVRFDPPTLRAPGRWALVNSVVTEGIFPRQATSHLIAVEPEWFQLSTTQVDPIGNKKPNAAYAIRPGADPTHAQCLTILTVGSWLPNRVIPDCIRLGETGLSNYVPNGEWDVVAVHDINPPGKVRSAPTPWAPDTVTVASASKVATVTRIPNLALAIGVELLGGDDVLGVGEDDTVRVTLVTSSKDVVGSIIAMGFSSSSTKIVRVESDGGGAEIGTPSPVPTPPLSGGFSMFTGETLVFDVPIHGQAIGPIRLLVKGGGVTKWFGENRAFDVTLPVSVVLDPPPPVRPTIVCGLDVFTYVDAPSTFDTLVVESANTIEVGTALVVDPCTPNAEEVVVDAIDGTTLTVSPSMEILHPTDTPIVRKPIGSSTTSTLPGGSTTTTVPGGTTSTTLPGGTTTTTTSPGATTTTTTTLPPCTSSRCQVDDVLAGEACDGLALPAKLIAKIDKGIAAIDAAANQTGKQAKKARAKARKLMRGAATLAGKSGRGKKPKLEPTCATELRGVLSSLAGAIPR